MSEPQDTPEAPATPESKESRGFHGVSALSASLPLLVSIGGAVAAGLGATAVRKHQDEDGDVRDDDDGWLDSVRDRLGDYGGSLVENGAKIAGVAGILKAIGTRNYSGAAVLAAKALAAKRIAEYTAKNAGHATAKAGRGVAKGVAHHPLVAAGSAAAALRARRAAKNASAYAHEGYDRTRDAARVLRHGRQSLAAPASGGVASAAVTGLALLAVGAAAMYLFDQKDGERRRAALREGVIGGLGKAKSRLGDAAGTAGGDGGTAS